MSNANEMSAYLFVHFIGTDSDANHEQIYFSVSRDGTNWHTLNDKKPILTSNIGECGVRDPHITRSPNGDKYYIIATDLSIYNRRNDPQCWVSCQKHGSRGVVVWESTDLVNWTAPRLEEIAAENAGCTWAPETAYDEENERYMVFWASKTADDDYTSQRIYRCYTKDFKSFTKPEIYIDSTEHSNIDTTIIKEGGVYYRFTKNETDTSIIMDCCTSLDGEFKPVETYTINGKAGTSVKGYEGPTAYKLNGENKWCLMLDHFSTHEGYKAFMTDDISKGVFTSADNMVFETVHRHGTVMPITEAEYNTLISAF